MNSNSAVKLAVRFALLAGAGAVLAVPSVFAQDAPQNSQATNQSSTTPVQLGKVQVTGTRIMRTSVETAQPVTIITAQQIQQSGLTTVGDVLQNLTQSGASLNTLFNNGGNGSTTIDLRYFGSNRVLVLVNGQRWPTSLGGTVDLNNIPSAIIDHIEILQDGASAIYGSDAITGVVNLITVKNFNGAQANAYMGMYHNTYQGFDHWDGKEQSYNATIGTSGERSGVVMSASYTNQDSVWAGSRAQSKEAIWTQGGGSSFSAAGRFIVATGQNGQQFGQSKCGVISKSSSGTCDMTLINTPTNSPSLSNFRDFTRADEYNYAPSNYFATPLETKTLYMQGHFDIADNVTFTAMGEANVRDSQTILAPAPLGFGLAGISHFNGQTFGIGANNPYNPFGKDLVTKSSQFCPTGKLQAGPNAGAACTPNLLLVLLGRRPIEAGDRISSPQVTAYTYRMGMNGFFDAIGTEWDWDVGANYGNITTLGLSTGGFNTAQLTSALDTPGAAQCNGPGQATQPKGDSVEVNGLYYPILIPGCVPANFFGGYNQATGQGSLTPAMLRYIQYESHSIGENTMRDYTANITGSLFNLPAGPLAVAVGAEYLENDGFSHPEALAEEGNVDEGGGSPTQGRIWTHGEYLELNIPILSDVPLAKSLSVDLANRWSQFKWTGGIPGTTEFGINHNANATTARAQFRWQPTEDLLFRGSWAQGFRVPDMDELYSGLSVGFPGLLDPCAPNTQNGGWNPTTPLPAGCNGIQHVQPDAQIQTTSGGNPNVSPEHAISKSVGFVYNPEWIPGFDISADFYDIDLLNVVGANGPQFVLNECYLHQDPTYCARIQTAGGGKIITDILANNTNTGETYSRGVDVAAHYHFPATALGNFTLSTNWTFVRSFVNIFASSSSPSGWQSSEQVGFVSGSFTGVPQKKGNVTLNWNYGDWSADWRIQYIGKVFEGCTGVTIKKNECSNPTALFGLNGADSTGENQLGTTIYHDVSVTYHVDPMHTDFTFGIRNLFNKQPPAALTAFANSFIPTMGYRLPGIFYYANIGVKF